MVAVPERVLRLNRFHSGDRHFQNALSDDAFMIESRDKDFDLTHKNGGNGWAIVQELGDDFYKISAITPQGIGDRALLAWGKYLSKTRVPIDLNDKNSPMRDVPLEGVTLEKVREI